MNKTKNKLKNPKIIFSKILLFFLPFILAYPFLEYQLSKVPTIYSKKKEFIESQLNTIQILGLGSSHGDDLNPDYLQEKTFTLINRTQDLYYDLQLLNYYIDRMPRLKLVILPISYFSIEYQMDRSIAWSQAPYYFHVWGIPPQHWGSIINLRYFSLTANYGWETVVRLIGNGFHDREWENMKTNGWWLPENRVLDDTLLESELGYARVLSHQKLMSPMSTAENIIVLEKIISICQKRDIKVLLLTTPAHHTYYDYMNPVLWNEVQNSISLMVKKYDVYYKNYLKDPRFSNLDFSDNDHLNNQGAMKFTLILYKEVVKPLLIE